MNTVINAVPFDMIGSVEPFYGGFNPAAQLLRYSHSFRIQVFYELAYGGSYAVIIVFINAFGTFSPAGIQKKRGTIRLSFNEGQNLALSLHCRWKSESWIWQV